MHFVRYYARLLAENGPPNLSVDDHKRLFNIISLENRIDELIKIEGLVGDGKGREHFERSEHLKRQLNKLTNHSVPHLVFAAMLEKQEH